MTSHTFPINTPSQVAAVRAFIVQAFIRVVFGTVAEPAANVTPAAQAAAVQIVTNWTKWLTQAELAGETPTDWAGPLDFAADLPESTVAFFNEFAAALNLVQRNVGADAGISIVMFELPESFDAWAFEYMCRQEFLRGAVVEPELHEGTSTNVVVLGRLASSGWAGEQKFFIETEQEAIAVQDDLVELFSNLAPGYAHDDIVEKAERAALYLIRNGYVQVSL